MNLEAAGVVLEYRPLALNEVETALVAALEDGAPRVTLDLDALKTLDSEAVRGLITLLRRSRDFSGTLALRTTSPDIRRTLEVMALDRLFPIITAAEVAP